MPKPLRVFIFKLIALTTLLIAMGFPVVAKANEQERLELHWEISLQHESPTNRLPPQRGAIVDYARTTDDAIVLFKGNSFARQISSLGTVAEQSRIEVDASLYAITPATGGGAFVTGAAQHWHLGDILRLTESSFDAIVARITSSGEVIWRTEVGGAGFQVGTEIIELAGGNIVVAGSNGYDMLLWSFDANGSLIWERHLGRVGGSIAPLPSGGLALVGSEPRGAHNDFVEDVILWVLNNSGEILHSTVVRKAINTSRGSHYLKTTVIADTNAIALSTVWPSYGDAKQLEIAKYDPIGEPLWTAVPEEQNCEAVPVLETDGDIVVACATTFEDGTSRDLVVTRYSAENGSSTKVTAALPNCQQSQTSVMIRILRSDPSHTLLLGSRPPYNVGESCTWLGTMLAPLH